MARSAANRAGPLLALLSIGACSLEHLSGGPADGGAGLAGTGGGSGSSGSGGDAAVDVAPDVPVKPSNVIWARRFGSGSADQEGTALAVHTTDCPGVCVVAGGYFHGEVDFGGAPLSTTTTPNDIDAFVSVLTGEGGHRWSLDFGDQRDQRVRDLAVDSKANVLVTGYFRGVLALGQDEHETDPLWEDDVFVAKLSPTGSPVWLRRFGGPTTGGDDAYQAATSIAVDANDDVYVAGTFSGAITFEQEHDATDGQDIFLAKLDSDGTPAWSKAWDAHGSNNWPRIALGPDGDVYLTGHFSTVLNLGCSTPLDTKGSSDDAFVARFDGGGQCKWAKQFGSGSGGQFGRALGVHDNGDVVVAFEIGGDIDFGFGVLKGSGRDVVIARLAGDDGTPAWALRASDPGDQAPDALALDTDGAAIVVGHFSNSLTLADASTSVSLSSNGETDLFVLRLKADGSIDWLQGFGDIANDSARAVALDASGSIFVTGRFRGDVHFGNTLLSSEGGEGDIFIAKFGRAAPQ